MDGPDLWKSVGQRVKGAGWGSRARRQWRRSEINAVGNLIHEQGKARCAEGQRGLGRREGAPIGRRNFLPGLANTLFIN